MYRQLQINEGDGWFILNTRSTALDRHGNTKSAESELEKLRQRWIETVYPDAQFRIVAAEKL